MKRVFVALSLTALALAPVAYAGEAKLSDCLSMQKQFYSAVETAQPGNIVDTARDEANRARTLCASRLYADGVAHYAKALQILARG